MNPELERLAESRSSCDNDSVKTLSIRDARTHLSDVLEQVKNGEDIGIIAGDQIIQLKPVQVVAWENSYLYQEYGVTPKEWERFSKRMKRRRTKEKYVSFPGKFHPQVFAGRLSASMPDC